MITNGARLSHCVANLNRGQKWNTKSFVIRRNGVGGKNPNCLHRAGEKKGANGGGTPREKSPDDGTLGEYDGCNLACAGMSHS